MQALIGQILMISFLMEIAYLRPFVNSSDNFLAMGSNFTLWALMLSGACLKWSSITPNSKALIGVVQIILTVGITLVALLGLTIKAGIILKVRPYPLNCNL